MSCTFLTFVHFLCVCVCVCMAAIAHASVDALIVSLCVYRLLCMHVCVCIFPAALPPGMQHGSSEGDISADRRASFPSPLPSGVALNIKLFNLIQFPTTNTHDWIQMRATRGPTPGLVGAWDLGTLDLSTGAGTETRIRLELGMWMVHCFGVGGWKWHFCRRGGGAGGASRRWGWKLSWQWG